MGRMRTEMELALEQTQQGASYEARYALKRLMNEKEIHGPSDAKLNPPQPLKVDLHGFEDGGEDFRYSDTERLSRSDEVLKLKNFKKDATLKLSKSTNQEWYEHVGLEVTRSQDDKIIKRAGERERDPLELGVEFCQEFLMDMADV
ncbi:hypothetical protein Tco_0991072 [Tanacetum coccineum]|uniref:Uncharacterized protein n=1 Tax=Tanacetum coccineum TaxID=301880 RepID=A0ABQ5EYZ4_9ASTR